MRRVWLLLFAFMLPLQAAWAATHGYAHDAKAEAHAVVAAHAEDADHKSDAKGHGCCDMAHSCHGSPSIVSTPPMHIHADKGKSLTPFSQAFLRREMVSRHERPQWSPA